MELCTSKWATATTATNGTMALAPPPGSLTAALSAPSLSTRAAEPKLRVACFSMGSWGTGVARQAQPRAAGMCGSVLAAYEALRRNLACLGDLVPLGRRMARHGWAISNVGLDSLMGSQGRCGHKFDSQHAINQLVSMKIVPAAETMKQINETGFDERHLPGLRLPRNVRATVDPVEAGAVDVMAAKDADLLIFVVFGDDMQRLMEQLQGQVKPTATAVVMSKILMPSVDKQLKFGSAYVHEALGLPVAVLMGGTLAADVARGMLGHGSWWLDVVSEALLELFNKPNFAVQGLPSPRSVELFAVLKSIIAVAAGVLVEGVSFVGGEGGGLGAVELSKFANRFYPEHSSKERCHGWDIIASSYGDSRTRRCADAFAKEPAKGWEEVAKEQLRSGMPSGAIAKIIARNCQRRAEFQKQVEMWVHEEEVDGRKLTEIINSDHENVKYLPGIELPHNLHAAPDVSEVVKDAAILVFVLPHQFLPGLLKSIKGLVSPDVMAVSLVKGGGTIRCADGSLVTGSQLISSELNCTCAVLNGANVANDVAHENFAEVGEFPAWILSEDVLGVELCGGFKNVVALAAGFSDAWSCPCSNGFCLGLVMFNDAEASCQGALPRVVAGDVAGELRPGRPADDLLQRTQPTLRARAALPRAPERPLRGAWVGR
eukprot:Skav236522  [mRNA]  locus=scaffold78:989127:1009985:- [translate_table: standard]